jgi:hypothetical protein
VTPLIVEVARGQLAPAAELGPTGVLLDERGDEIEGRPARGVSLALQLVLDALQLGLERLQRRVLEQGGLDPGVDVVLRGRHERERLAQPRDVERRLARELADGLECCGQAVARVDLLGLSERKARPRLVHGRDRAEAQRHAALRLLELAADRGLFGGGELEIVAGRQVIERRLRQPEDQLLLRGGELEAGLAHAGLRLLDRGANVAVIDRLGQGERVVEVVVDRAAHRVERRIALPDLLPDAGGLGRGTDAGALARARLQDRGLGDLHVVARGL